MKSSAGSDNPELEDLVQNVGKYQRSVGKVGKKPKGSAEKNQLEQGRAPAVPTDMRAFCCWPFLFPAVKIACSKRKFWPFAFLGLSFNFRHGQKFVF